MLAVVVSRADEASEHIGEQLLDLAEWEELEDERRSDGNGGGRYYRTEGIELRTFDDLHLNLDGVAATFDDPDLLVFASRHAGDTGPLLTAHATGNFGPAEYGGRAGSLARAAPNALSVVRAELETHAPTGYDVGIECTHHGPSTVGCPSLFARSGARRLNGEIRRPPRPSPALSSGWRAFRPTANGRSSASVPGITPPDSTGF